MYGVRCRVQSVGAGCKVHPGAEGDVECSARGGGVSGQQHSGGLRPVGRMIQHSGFRGQGLGSKAQRLMFRVQGVGFRFQGLGFRV